MLEEYRVDNDYDLIEMTQDEMEFFTEHGVVFDLEEATIRKTKKFISRVHDREQGQTYGGRPYSDHPKMVMRLGKKLFGGGRFGQEERKAALLHDTIEDTPTTPETLSRRGFSPSVVGAVKLLTKDKSKSYEGNIQNIIGGDTDAHRIAQKVKYADNFANFIAKPKAEWTPERIKAQKAKYYKSMVALGNKLGVNHHEKVKNMHEETELDETVLNIQQRQKRAQVMRRYKVKIERAREVAKKRMASEGNIKKRSYAKARQIFRKKYAGSRGAEYENLGPSEKMEIDRVIDKKSKAIKKLAIKLIPKIKRAEYARLASFTKGQAIVNHGAVEGKLSEEFNDLFLEYFGSSLPGNTGSTGERTDNPIVSTNRKVTTKKNVGDKNYVVDKVGKIKAGDGKSPIIQYGKFGEELENDSAIYRSIAKKADRFDIPEEILGEVYDRGIDAWNESINVSPQQYAFARVNSFINQGKTYFNEDSDLAEKRGLWDNIHAKRERIKRGSKGAPSDQDFKNAQESVQIDEANKYSVHKGKEGWYVNQHTDNGVWNHSVQTGYHDSKQKAVAWAKKHAAGREHTIDIKEETELDETIRKTKHGYRLVSKSTGKNLGEYPTKEGAEKRERQVQYFKHQHEETQIDEMDKTQGSRRSFDNFRGQDKTGKVITTKKAEADALAALNKSFKKEEVELDEGAIRDAEKALADHDKRRADYEKKNGPMTVNDARSHEITRKKLLAKKRSAQRAFHKKFNAFGEEVQIDEISQATKARYVVAAKKSKAMHSQVSDDYADPESPNHNWDKQINI